VPTDVRFATKLVLARRMLERAFDAGVAAGWVVADSFSGRSQAFRRWLEERQQPYVLQVPKTNTVWYDGRRQTAAQLGERLPAAAWSLRSVGQGVQGERCSLWTCLPLSDACPAGKRRWLLIQQDVDDPTDRAYHLAYGPADTTAAELLRVCGSRWQIEAGFAQAKGEVGLDQYEVRRWTAWHRFVTLCLVAHAYLVVTRCVANAAEQAAAKGGPAPT
jgi:SRSO17 transposase